jgi:orsellinic acid C2-O-methyltransferase
VCTGEVAFEKVFGQNAWDHRAQNPDSAQDFDAGMASFIDAHHHAVLNAYPFAKLESLYDIGGGDGQFMCTVLSACPALRGLVLDQPHVVTRTQQRLQEARLGERCQAVAGDIFASIPTGGAAYMLSRVLHDWNDAQTAQILTVCRRAMSEHSVLLLAERVMPEQVDVRPQTQALVVSDLNMLVMTGGCERTPSQYQSLLEAAGFSLHTITATDTAMSVIEARPH